MELPKDPMMLFSVINMKLRDCYASLDELCEDMNISKDILIGNWNRSGSNTMPNKISSGKCAIYLKSPQIESMSKLALITAYTDLY